MVSEIHEFILSWNEFENIVDKNNDEKEEYDLIAYRGHANYGWELKPTLARFLGDSRTEIRASHYYAVMREIYSKKIPEIRELSLEEESPFLINAWTGDENHHSNMVKSFSAMIELRHLGFPSPILDWTINYRVATFFAFVNEDVSNKAIFCIKHKKRGQTFEEKKIDLFVPEVQHYRPEDFYRQEDGELISSLPRHCRQESVYTLQMYNDKDEYSSSNKNDPFFYLSHMADPRYTIEKYIIKDSRENRLDIIDSLYKKGITYEYIYEKTHSFENTHLKDIAVKKLLLNN